jgi:alpha-L-fucosidase 2
MLLQSHAGTIQVLPALPGAWPAGGVDGLRARGAVTVGATWRAGHATRIRLRCDHGGLVRLRSSLLTGHFRLLDAAGRAIRWARDGADTIRFDTRAGAAYRVLG